MSSSCPPSIPAPTSATRVICGRCRHSIRRAGSSCRSTCSATDCRPRRATPRRPSTGLGFPLVTLLRQCRMPASTAHRGARCQAPRPRHWDGRWPEASPTSGASQFPDMVDAILPFCASARTSPHNQLFLDGARAALMADCAFAGGYYASPPKAGLRAFARVYAGWAFSQTFYRERLHRELGFETWEELVLDWERDHLAWDANDLVAKLRTWQLGDISANEVYRGELRTRARRDPGPGDPRSLHHGSLLPARGQRHRSRSHAERRAPPLRLALGSLRRQPEPRGQRVSCVSSTAASLSCWRSRASRHDRAAPGPGGRRRRG